VETMQRIFVLCLLAIVSLTLNAQKLTVPGVKWEENYSFDHCNKFKVDFYDKNKKLMRSMDYQTYYQSSGKDFNVMLVDDGRGNGTETIFDIKNEVAIQIYKSKNVPYMHNAGKFKYPEGSEIKKLELVPTSETKEILGYTCKKYTYTYKKIFGEAWITDQITLSNDYGMFRAAKMAALHNTLSVGGFVMEMTTEDAKGGKTVMRTVSLMNNEKYTKSTKGVEMGTAINKTNYYIF
jgi:GLPGLI family protein